MLSFLFFSQIVFLIFSTFAEDVISYETKYEDPKVPEQNQNSGKCYFCTLPLPNNSVNLDQLCGDDPYKVVCANNKKNEEKTRTTKKDIDSAIAEGEKKALTAMGYNSMESAIADALKSKNIKANTNSLGMRQALKRGDVSSLNEDINTFPMSEECENKMKTYKQEEFDSTISNESKITLKNKLNEDLKNIRADIKIYETYQEDVFSLEPQTIYDTIASWCFEYKNQNYEPIKQSDLYRKFREDCNNILKIQSEAIDLYRQKNNSLTSKQKTNEFYYKFKYIDRLGEVQFVGSSVGINGEIERLIHNIKNEIKRFNFVCHRIANDKEIAADLVQETIIKVHTNKIFIDHINTSIFGDSDKYQASIVAEAARKNVLGSIETLFPKSPQKQRMISTLSKIEVQTSHFADEDQFINKNGNLYLDSFKLGTSLRDDYLGQFYDPTLSSLREFNPYYSAGYGAMPTHVCPLGSAFHMAKTNPYSLFTVFSHEFGHHIDADDWNGFGNDHTALLNCLRDPSSIRMQSQQRGEASADYIASVSLLKELNQMPEATRKHVFIESLKFFCDFSDKDGFVSMEQTHPELKLRVNGIYFANPEIRKLLGCSHDNYKYKTCP